jgi:hypothetical protein
MPISGPVHAINFQSIKPREFARPEKFFASLCQQGFSGIREDLGTAVSHNHAASFACVWCVTARKRAFIQSMRSTDRKIANTFIFFGIRVVLLNHAFAPGFQHGQSHASLAQALDRKSQTGVPRDTGFD